MNKKGFILPLAIIVGSAMIVAVFAYFTYVINTKENNPVETNNTSNIECEVSGCSNNICTEKGKEVWDTCQVEEWYQCFTYSKCEIQANDECSWTVTDEYDECMKSKNPNYQKVYKIEY